MNELFGREDIVDLLNDLGRRLDDRGLRLDIYVVGGTAMVLAYDRTRLTRDIDAVWDQVDPVSEAIAEIAEERGYASADVVRQKRHRIYARLRRDFSEQRSESLFE